MYVKMRWRLATRKRWYFTSMRQGSRSWHFLLTKFFVTDPDRVIHALLKRSGKIHHIISKSIKKHYATYSDTLDIAFYQGRLNYGGDLPSSPPSTRAVP
jgi:hypothetical protein